MQHDGLTLTLTLHSQLQLPSPDAVVDDFCLVVCDVDMVGADLLF